MEQFDSESVQYQYEVLDKAYKVDESGIVYAQADPSQEVDIGTVIKIHKRFLADYNKRLAAIAKVAGSAKTAKLLSDEDLAIYRRGALNSPQENAELWWAERRREALAAVRSLGASYNPSDIGESERFIKVLTAGAATPLDIAVFRHMLWQVKRKLNGRSTKDEMFLNLVGKQGVGKTYSLREILFKPLRGCFTELPLQQLLDDRVGSFEHVFVNMFEELQGSQKADVEKLKSLITAQRSYYRPMGTNITATSKLNLTCVGTSNVSVYDCFRDATGMRRFYEIELAPALDRAALNRIDARAIWDGIDASIAQPHYLEPVRKELEARQAAEAFLDSFQEWLQETPIAAGPIQVKGTEMYERYKRHCIDTGAYTLKRQGFYKRLVKEGIKRDSYANATTFCLDEISANQYFKNGIATHSQFANA
jgi:hypothetical protein